MAFATLTGSYATAQAILFDQINDPLPITQYDNVAGLSPIQTFQPTLDGIDFVDFLCTATDGTPAQLNVRLRAGVGGTMLGTSQLVEVPDGNAPAWFRFQFPSRVALVPDQTYALELVQVGGGTGWVSERLEDNYPRGTAYWDGTTPKDYDYNFREGIILPEPVGLALALVMPCVLLSRAAREP